MPTGCHFHAACAGWLLLQVPNASQVKGGGEDAGVEPYPCLTGSCLATWYRASFEGLQAQWESVVQSAASASQQKELRDEECVASVVAGCMGCASTFSALVVSGGPGCLHTHPVCRQWAGWCDLAVGCICLWSPPMLIATIPC